MPLKSALILVLLTYGQLIFAQKNLPTPVNIQKTYENKTRSTTGQPGIKYWQNRADYDIKIAFDPKTNHLTGNETIEYFNNSSDTLNTITFKLYPNYYKKGAVRQRKIEDIDANDGVNIESFKVDDLTYPSKYLNIDGTNMMVGIKPLFPGEKMRFDIKFSYILNKTSHMRTGQVDDGSFFVAYFFPRIAVYDDIDGWNNYQYTGEQEFYNDFCNFKTAITLPNDYLAWATGDLQNCNEVLDSKYCDRIKIAEKEDDIRFIIDSTDLKLGNITKTLNSTNTWQFEAKNVTDFAMAFSNHYLWQSSSIEVDKTTHRRTRVDAVFNKNHADYYKVAGFGRKTVEAMSYKFPKWPYPYNHETVFDGLDQMEYPMMVNDNPVENEEASIELTVHEIFHTMFPFYMGVNETKYGWMDEGWATIGEWLISQMIDSTIVDKYGIYYTAKTAGTEIDLPIITPTANTFDISMFINTYSKPALGYFYVKDMLGDALFTKALHHYIKTWQGKHPMPNDFFYSMNVGAGKNLNWFWEKWFFGGGILDLGIKNVKGQLITIENLGEKPMPIDLEINYSDGTVEKIHQSISAWQLGNKTAQLKTKSTKKIKKITLGSTYVPDSNEKNNVFIAK
jgi:Peptidase family M1 domain